MGTARQWVRHLTGQELLDLNNLFEMYTLTKSSHWAYQKEWRCLRANPDALRDVAPLVQLNALVPEEIGAIYLGCRISPEDRKAILSLVASRVPHARVFQARRSRTKFALVFERVTQEIGSSNEHRRIGRGVASNRLGRLESQPTCAG